MGAPDCYKKECIRTLLTNLLTKCIKHFETHRRCLELPSVSLGRLGCFNGEVLVDDGSMNVLIFKSYLVQLHTFDQALTLAVWCWLFVLEVCPCVAAIWWPGCAESEC